VLIRQIAGLALKNTFSRLSVCINRKNILSVWPPCKKINEFNLLIRALKFYLGDFNLPIQTFIFDPSSCNAVTMTLSTVDTSPCNSTFVLREAKRRHFSAKFRIWNVGLLNRILPLRPYDYIISFEQPAATTNELLRLSKALINGKEFDESRMFSFAGPQLESCAIVCPGPSSELFKNESNKYNEWIGANAIVMNRELCHSVTPFAICVLDPHCFSNTETGLALRKAIIELINKGKTKFITVLDFEAIIPNLFPRSCWKQIYFVESVGLQCYRLKWGHSCSRLQIPRFSNVLTDLMLPLATTMAKSITLYGCDGIPPGTTGSFPKASALSEHDRAEMQEVKKYNKMPGSELYHQQMQQNTAFVVEKCKKKGALLKLRVKSWNSGLKNVPVVI